MSKFADKKRLKRLEYQLKNYTEEDYLKEAAELEREMAEKSIHYELPDNFFTTIIAKGKLIEAERKYRAFTSSDDTEKSSKWSTDIF